MASEVELKLELSSDAVERVAQLPWLHALDSGPPEQEKLVSVYFETA